MIHIPLDFDRYPVPTMQQTWAQRHAVVEDCARSLSEKFVRYFNTTDPFQLFTNIVCNAMVVALRLHVRRPMYRFSISDPPPHDDFNVLEVATEVLEQSSHKTENNAFKTWKWFAWVKWHALAIVLTELLCEDLHGPLVERAWNIAETGFAKVKNTIQDPVLWTSLEKLMGKAQSVRMSNEDRTDITSVEIVPNHLQTLSLARAEEQRTHFGLPEETTTRIINDGTPYQYNSEWDQSEILSWVNWESFIQDFGTIPMGLSHSFYSLQQ
jgi:hypothetical protein